MKQLKINLNIYLITNQSKILKKAKDIYKVKILIMIKRERTKNKIVIIDFTIINSLLVDLKNQIHITKHKNYHNNMSNLTKL